MQSFRFLQIILFDFIEFGAELLRFSCKLGGLLGVVFQSNPQLADCTRMVLYPAGDLSLQSEQCASNCNRRFAWLCSDCAFGQETLNRQMVGCEASAACACPGRGFDYRRHAAVKLNEVSSSGLFNPGACVRVRVRDRDRVRVRPLHFWCMRGISWLYTDCYTL